MSKELLRSLYLKRVGEGFVINTTFGDNPPNIVEEEKVAGSLPKLKKIIKFYLDELKEDLNAN